MTKLSKRVRDFREQLKPYMNQAAFAEALDVPASQISLAEGAGTKKRKPSSDLMVRIGNFAAERGLFSDALWFCEQAGLMQKNLKSIGKSIFTENSQHLPPDQFVTVKPLAGIEQNGPVQFVHISQIPNPETTSYARIEGDFRQLKYGDILFIDESEKDLLKLEWSYVAVYRRPDPARQRRHQEAEALMTKEQVEEYRESQDAGSLHYGVFAGWLRSSTESIPGLIHESKRSAVTWFFLEAPSRLADLIVPSRSIGRFNPGDKSIRMDAGITILGRVVAWIAARR